ncbi:MarR family winged helix-turn-helix transcriptional regulator [uncultured Mycobacterium sp.]|uniref:MarR family winged helix-turn-helix transcriptional regulator n=1 Tax=uncultured Mycobacterium sp. TaxID=171292 RepID=UPI0035C9553D
MSTHHHKGQELQESETAEPFPGDRVDALMRVAGEETPAAAREAKALAYRIRRIARRLENEMRRELSGYGIELWELELLAALIRARPHHQLTAGELAAELQLTSGTITNRITRVENKGWIHRHIDPSDRRQILVTLTPQGHTRAREVFATKTLTEATLLAPLSAAKQHQLNNDLRVLLVALEGPLGFAPYR